MKRNFKLSAFIFFFSLSANLLAQNFWVPDANFRNLLKTKYPSCFTVQDSMVTNCSAIQNELFLNIESYNISDISGIEYFTSLETFNCENNFIDTIYSLPNTLLYFTCDNNQLSSLPALPSTLLSLIFGDNPIHSITAFPPNLIAINFGNNNLDSIPSLPIHLNYFASYNNPLVSLPTLPNTIRELYISNSFITALPVMPDSLRKAIFINNDYLTSLPNLPDSLSELNCFNNKLNSLPTLPNGLIKIECQNNLLTTLPTLPSFLTSLKCENNLITTLPLLPDSLTYLSCWENLLTSLPPLPNSLISLWCGDNPIYDLPSLPGLLKYLECTHSNLTTLPSLPISLLFLDCSVNPISCLPHLPASLSNLNFDSTFVSCIPNHPNLLTQIRPVNPIICQQGVSICNAKTKGYVFFDGNGNGLLDIGEKGIPSLISFLAGYSIFADSNGYFIASSDTGSITFYVNIPNYYTTTNPSFQTIHVTPNYIDTVYFGLQPIANINDLLIDLVNYEPLRPGFKTNYKIHYQNSGTNSISNAKIKFLKPSLLNNLSSIPAATGSNGDTLIWSIGNLNPYQEGYITILDSVSTGAIIGLSADADAWIEPIAGDTTPQDNYKRCHEIIRGSFDPNDKSVSPEFVSPNQTDYLEYVIRFQNTGTDTAFSVLVTDTLSTLLDASTIELISASHKNNFWVENGIAKWYFATILLPDSNTNEANSHGFVKFRIKQKANLNTGIQIANTAHIYFDYNIPVATNTAVVSITPLLIEEYKKNNIQIFPNPVHNFLFLKTKESSLGEVSICDESGKLIELKIITSSFFTWNIEQLQRGVYIVNGKNWKAKLIKN